MYLTDIKIIKLQSFLQNIKDDSKQYLSLNLNQKFEKKHSYNFFAFTDLQEINIENYFIFKKKPLKIIIIDNENLTKLLSKVSNNTSSNKFKELNENLKSLENIYIQYINLEGHD